MEVGVNGRRNEGQSGKGKEFVKLERGHLRSCVYGFLASPRASFLLCAHFWTFKLVLMKAFDTMARAIPNQVMSSYLTAFGSSGTGVVPVIFGMSAGPRFPGSCALPPLHNTRVAHGP